MLKAVPVPLAAIYVPSRLKGSLDAAKVAQLAEAIAGEGLRDPIQVRPDPERKRYVLVAGLHRLEALRQLGETAIPAFVVQARRA